MRHISSVILIVAVGACSNDSQVTQPRETVSKWAPIEHYKIITLSPFLGGATSVGTGINRWGSVAGYSNLPDDQSRHGVVWRDGSLIDLRTLGGPNSSVQWPGLNNRGMVVGIAETAEMNPLPEDWSCSAFFPTVTHHICRGFVWESGSMKALPTLGGYNGFATGINDRGQVVGWAETPVHDPTCNTPQVLQFRATLWEPRSARMRELRPFAGDSTSAATAINESGQVVGISGDCDVAVGRFSARHAVLWEHGKVTQIGNLGGVSWHTPMAINQRGDVAGFSNPPGDADGSFIVHAFLWTRQGGIKDLDKFPGDDFSQAFGINDRRQVVGRSCGASGCRAVLWHDGAMTELKALVAPDYPNLLVAARAINDRGQITGNLVESSSGHVLPFVATPTRASGDDSDGAPRER